MHGVLVRAAADSHAELGAALVRHARGDMGQRGAAGVFGVGLFAAAVE